MCDAAIGGFAELFLGYLMERPFSGEGVKKDRESSLVRAGGDRISEFSEWLERGTTDVRGGHRWGLWFFVADGVVRAEETEFWKLIEWFFPVPTRQSHSSEPD